MLFGPSAQGHLCMWLNIESLLVLNVDNVTVEH